MKRTHTYIYIFVLLINAAKFRELNPDEWSNHGRGTVEKIVSDCRLTRLIDNLNPLSSLIRPSNTLTSKRERSPCHIHLLRSWMYSPVVIFVIPSFLILLSRPSPVFRFIYLTKLLVPFTDWTYENLLRDLFRPLSISSQFTLDLV